jgi:hypothetical protein
MPRGSAEPERPRMAAALREQAAQARRLARSVTSDKDRRALNEIAKQLDADAAELERSEK